MVFLNFPLIYRVIIPAIACCFFDGVLWFKIVLFPPTTWAEGGAKDKRVEETSVITSRINAIRAMLHSRRPDTSKAVREIRLLREQLSRSLALNQALIDLTAEFPFLLRKSEVYELWKEREELLRASLKKQDDPLSQELQKKTIERLCELAAEMRLASDVEKFCRLWSELEPSSACSAQSRMERFRFTALSVNQKKTRFEIYCRNSGSSSSLPNCTEKSFVCGEMAAILGDRDNMATYFAGVGELSQAWLSDDFIKTIATQFCEGTDFFLCLEWLRETCRFDPFALGALRKKVADARDSQLAARDNSRGFSKDKVKNWVEACEKDNQNLRRKIKGGGQSNTKDASLLKTSGDTKAPTAPGSNAPNAPSPLSSPQSSSSTTGTEAPPPPLPRIGTVAPSDKRPSSPTPSQPGTSP